jgi:hypothetical protein
LRITRYPSLAETQFLGCVSAFVDSFFGELNAAALSLRRLENRAKGSAFAFEMALDTNRYGALIVLDRWRALVGCFGPHQSLSRRATIITAAGERIGAAEMVLGRVNQVIDAADHYSGELVEACALAFQSLNVTFEEERTEAEQAARMGPMLPEDYREARRIFLEDLAVR